MKKVSLLVCLFTLLHLVGTAQSKKISVTRWRATIQTKGGELPFGLEVQPRAKQRYTVYILNASERLQTDEATLVGDSLVIPIAMFDAELVAKLTPTTMTGFYRRNKGRKTFAETTFSATLGYGYRFRTNRMAILGNVTGKWNARFTNPETQKTSTAVGTFQQKGTDVVGSFLTTTGDYRFLDGSMRGDSLFVSTFDGSNAYLLKAKVVGKKMTGTFYSGIKGIRSFEAEQDDKAALPDLNKITFLKKGYDKVSFAFPDDKGNVVSLADPAFKDKVVVVQILGSWCPNCMDEINYLVPFYQQYKAKGVEIVGLAYEKTLDTTFFRGKMNLLRKRLKVTYPLLQAGLNSSESATESLPMLNQVIGFPTSIIIDKKGVVREIHTGFTGPGTGNYYTEWVKHFEGLIDTLVKE